MWNFGGRVAVHMRSSVALLAASIVCVTAGLPAAPAQAASDTVFCVECRRVVIDEKGAYIHHQPRDRIIGWIRTGTEVFVLKSPDRTWCNVLIENGPYAVGNGGWALCATLGGFARTVGEERTFVYHAPNERQIGSIARGTEVYVLGSFQAEWCHVLINVNGPNGGWILCHNLGRPPAGNHA